MHHTCDDESSRHGYLRNEGDSSMTTTERLSMSAKHSRFRHHLPICVLILTALCSAVVSSQAPLAPISSKQNVSCGDFRLKVNPGWTLPASDAKTTWVFRYMRDLRKGAALPTTPLQIALYAQTMPYANETERRAAVEELRSAVWRGGSPVERTDTMKLADVKADRFMQKGTTGWRFYLFPYDGAQVYYVYVFSPGDTPEIAGEALQLLAGLKLNKPPKIASQEFGKPPKDYLKNVGSGLNFFSEDAEHDLGLSVSNQMNQTLSLVHDAAIQSYVESLGRSLVAASRNPGLECRFFVVNTKEVNAFALPGCFVYVNRALIDMVQNEGQLAGVMSHEIGHVVGHHGVKQISKQLLILGLVAGVGEAVNLKSEKWAEVIETAGGVAAMLAKLKYSRDDEHQADALGVETMAAAGYDPHELVDFFHLLEPGSKVVSEQQIMGILSTHPLTADRERVLSEQIATMSYHASAEFRGQVAFRNCQTKLAGWPAPPPDRDVTLSAALAAAGMASDSVKK